MGHAVGAQQARVARVGGQIGKGWRAVAAGESRSLAVGARTAGRC